jgi:hypothetical protein
MIAYSTAEIGSGNDYIDSAFVYGIMGKKDVYCDHLSDIDHLYSELID